MDQQNNEQSQRNSSSSRARSNYRGRSNGRRPPANRNANDQNTTHNSAYESENSNHSSNHSSHHHHQRLNDQENFSRNSFENGQHSSERSNNRESSSGFNHGRRGATSFSTSRSNVQSARGRGRRQRPDFLILHSENTTFLKSMKNSQNHQPIQKDIAEEPEEANSNEIQCPFCTLSKPRVSGIKLQAITSCSHVMCFECALRWYFLSIHTTCPFCRQDLSKIIITNRLSSDHSNVQKLLYEYTHNSKLLIRLSESSSETDENLMQSRVYIDTAKGNTPLPMNIQDIVTSVLDFECTICVKRNVRNPFRYAVRYKDLATLGEINNHLRKEHRSTLCELCFMHLDNFVSEYQIFGENELQLHRKYGTRTQDKSAQVGPHPCCHLCDSTITYYYNHDELESHCRSIHCSCYVCTQTIFFRDPDALRKHVKDNHLLCTICADRTNQILGFSSIAEYRRHIEQEHPNVEFDLESLSTRIRQPELNFDSFDDEDNEITDRMANDQIDNILRQSFQANQHEFFNSSNVENYVTNFPSIEGMPNGERLLHTTQNVHVFPGRKNFGTLRGKQNYEQDFPEMGPSTSSANNFSGPSSATVAGLGVRQSAFNLSRLSGARNRRKVEYDSRPLNNVDIQGQQSQPSATWKGKKPKQPETSQKKKNNNGPSIFDDFIEPTTDSFLSSELVKPPAVSVIDPPECQDSLLKSLQRPQRLPKKEDFPSLGAPSSSRNNNNSSGLSGWSKVTAIEPEIKSKKTKQKNTQQVSVGQLEKKTEKLNLNDSNLFPSLAIPGVSSTQNGRPGAWNSEIPGSIFKRHGKLSGGNGRKKK